METKTTGKPFLSIIVGCGLLLFLLVGGFLLVTFFMAIAGANSGPAPKISTAQARQSSFYCYVYDFGDNAMEFFCMGTSNRPPLGSGNWKLRLEFPGQDGSISQHFQTGKDDDIGIMNAEKVAPGVFELTPIIGPFFGTDTLRHYFVFDGISIEKNMAMKATIIVSVADQESPVEIPLEFTWP